jgi:FAD-dependent urate hydroxylase
MPAPKPPNRSVGTEPVRCNTRAVADRFTHASRRQEEGAPGMTVDLEVAVIGAGPHGLSATVHMRRANVHAHLFGKPMSLWKRMPDGMKLRSNMAATNMVEPAGPLSLKGYLADLGDHQDWPVPLRRFVEYGTWVQRRAVPDIDERQVTHVTQASGGFHLELDDGDTAVARRVIIAAGIESFKYLPPGFEHLPRARISHTSHHSDLGAFAGQRVAVVGAGQSAFEWATLMKERGARHVEVLARSDDVVWLRSCSPKTLMGPMGPLVYAPTDVGPLWYSRLVGTPRLFRRLPRDLRAKVAYRSIRPACSYFVKVRLDDVRVTLGVRVTGATSTETGVLLSLSDGSSREVDHLMFGTGYRVDVGRYEFLDEGLLERLRREDGYPILRRGLESTVPGLHFLGAPAAFSFGPIMRFVSGSWYGGRSVARAVEDARTVRSALARG